MAATYTAYGSAIPWTNAAANKFALFNASGSGVTLKVYRIWAVNSQATAVTGVLGNVQILLLTALGTLTTTGCNIIKHDTNSAAIPAQVTCGYAGTNTNSTVWKRFSFSSNEAAVSIGVSPDLLSTFLPMTLLWDTGYGDNGVGVSPLTLNEGQGISCYAPVAFSNAGTTDWIIEFTT
jgi:hypothetical protein